MSWKTEEKRLQQQVVVTKCCHPVRWYSNIRSYGEPRQHSHPLGFKCASLTGWSIKMPFFACWGSLSVCQNWTEIPQLKLHVLTKNCNNQALDLLIWCHLVQSLEDFHHNKPQTLFCPIHHDLDGNSRIDGNLRMKTKKNSAAATWFRWFWCADVQWLRPENIQTCFWSSGSPASSCKVLTERSQAQVARASTAALMMGGQHRMWQDSQHYRDKYTFRQIWLKVWCHKFLGFFFNFQETWRINEGRKWMAHNHRNQR